MPVNPLDDLAADIPSDEKLASFRALVASLVSGQEAVAVLEAKLKEAKARVEALEFSLLPQAMFELRISELKLESGATVQLEDFMQASLAGKTRAAAINWLRQTGQTGLIKRTVSVAFGKGEEARSTALMETLRELGYTHELEETVHTGAFKSLVRECLAKKQEVPLKECGVFAGKKAVISL